MFLCDSGKDHPSLHRSAASAAFSKEGFGACDAALDLEVLDARGPRALSEGSS